MATNRIETLDPALIRPGICMLAEVMVRVCTTDISVCSCGADVLCSHVCVDKVNS